MATYWPYQQKDVWLAVPPGWDSKPLKDDGTPGGSEARDGHDGVRHDAAAARAQRAS